MAEAIIMIYNIFTFSNNERNKHCDSQ